MPALHPIVERLIEKRNIREEELRSFLNPSYEERPDPFLMQDMDRAVVRTLSAITNGEKIAAWTDYDCDGIPAGALLSDFFNTINHPLRSYIPDRSEGYGLNKKGLHELREEGITLLITADVGITNVDEVAYANELGIDVIVTDHHLPGNILPSAYAVLNPHRKDCAYPFKALSGTGVAFKFVEGLIKKGNFELSRGSEKWFLDLVALATVADMMPLIGENRALVHYGLIVLRKGRRKGLRALLETMRIPRTHVTEDDFSFSIAPKINAASRMGSPLLALELLTTNDEERARDIAKQLVKLNDSRKLEGARVAKEVKSRLDGAPLDSVIVLGNSHWNPALLGIAATNIVETYQRTVCLWGKDGDIIKGSCRSDGSVNIVSLMQGTQELFEDYGGHELSGGFSLKANAIHELPIALQKTYDTVRTNEVEPVEIVEDTQLTLSEASESLYNAMRTLAPFGIGNTKPLFKFERVRVEKVVWFGKHKEHVRITVSDDSRVMRDAIGFFVNRASYRNEVELLSPNDFVTLHAALEQSFFAGRKELRLRIEMVALGA